MDDCHFGYKPKFLEETLAPYGKFKAQTTKISNWKCPMKFEKHEGRVHLVNIPQKCGTK
jgi:hypothetical protein